MCLTRGPPPKASKSSSIFAARASSTHLRLSASPARNRKQAISLDFSEAAVRLPARLHRGNVHLQSATAGRMTAPTAIDCASDPAGKPLLSRYSGRAYPQRGPIPFAEFMRECLYHPEARLLFADQPPAALGITTPASTCIRYSGGCLRANWPKCGSYSDRLDQFQRGRKRGPELDGWRPYSGFPRAPLPAFYSSLEYVAVERSAARLANRRRGWRRI